MFETIYTILGLLWMSVGLCVSTLWIIQEFKMFKIRKQMQDVLENTILSLEKNGPDKWLVDKDADEDLH